MNLSQLRFADAVATTGSFTAAAAQCCVTQPTLSNGLAQLEDGLGARLFLRTTRKVSLTPFGTHVLPYLSEVLRAQATLVQQAQAFLSPSKRLVRIGTSPLVSAHLLRLMVEPFRVRHPDVDIVLREMNMSDLQRMLQDGLLDFVFGVGSEKKGPWVAAVLYHEPLLYIPSGATAPKTKSTRLVQFKDIADATYVMVPDACGLARATRALFRSHRRTLLEYSGEAMGYQVLQEWARLGIGAAIVPRSKLNNGRQAAFAIADKHGKEVTIRFDAQWLATALQAPHLREFADHLRNVVPALVTGLNRTASIE